MDPKPKLRSCDYSDAMLKKFAALAAKTSRANAARHFGVSNTTVARAQRLFGVKPRPPGNYNKKEVDSVTKVKGWTKPT